MDLISLETFTDYFVICTGSSDRMLDALADGVLDRMRKTHKKRGRREGLARDGWVILDLGSVIVHLFSPDQRAYYKLEQLWSDGKVLLRLQ
jgi:ribosome-associated protein